MIRRDELTDQPFAGIEDFSPGWDKCNGRLKRPFGGHGKIERVSFKQMERRGVREALSLDRHFAQAGFSLLVR